MTMPFRVRGWHKFAAVWLASCAAAMLYCGSLADPRSYEEILQRNLVRDRDFRVAFGDANIEKCLLIAPHGGGIEPGTSEIMRAVAEQGGWAWYEFAG